MCFKVAAVALIALAWCSTVTARMTPSRVTLSRTSSDASLTTIAVDAISDRLTELGLSADDANARLALLSTEDIRHLATNIDHLQTAGMTRKTKWVVFTIAAVIVVIWAIDQAGSPYAW